MKTAQYWIETLGLLKHPEGGYYKETFRSSLISNLGVQGATESRSLSTSIYYLLNSGEVSYFHKLKSDEIWYFHYGSAIRIHQINNNGEFYFTDLGINPEKGALLQAIIPAGTIFGAEVLDSNSYSLIGCMVSPGFDFRDFEMMDREILLSLYPLQKYIIEKLSV